MSRQITAESPPPIINFMTPCRVTVIYTIPPPSGTKQDHQSPSTEKKGNDKL